MEDREVYYTHRDGEEETSWHPIASYIQGSLARERAEGHSRIPKDRKEFRKVRKLNKRNRISLIQLLEDTSARANQEEKAVKLDILQTKLASLGASYPNVPGLGLYIKGLHVLQGKGEAKKIFDLLFYISSYPDLCSYYKFIFLGKIGKIILNRNMEGKWIENDRLIFSMLGLNELAYSFGLDCLGNNPSAIKDSMKNGERLANYLTIEFYENTVMYKPKVRRRGYARSSPGSGSPSKDAILEANTSEEALRADGTLYQNEEGEWVMDEKKDIEETIFKIFSNSLEAYQSYQRELLEKEKKRVKSEKILDPPTDK